MTIVASAPKVFVSTGVKMDGIAVTTFDGKFGGDVYVSDDTDNEVLRFDRNGNPNPDPLYPGTDIFISAGLAGLSDPTGLAIASYTTTATPPVTYSVLFVSSFATNKVLYYYTAAPDTTNGTYATTDLDGPERIAFNFDSGSTVGTPGDMYVTNYLDNEVITYNATSSTASANPFVYVTDGYGALTHPVGLTIYNNGTLLVSSETANPTDPGTQNPAVPQHPNLVIAYPTAATISGTVSAATTAFFTPEPLYNPDDIQTPSGSTNLFVSSTGMNEVMEYSSTSGVLSNYLGIAISDGLGGLSSPQGLAFDPTGNLLFVSSPGTAANPLNEVIEYTLVAGVWTNPVTFVASGAGGLDGPRGWFTTPTRFRWRMFSKAVFWS